MNAVTVCSYHTKPNIPFLNIIQFTKQMAQFIRLILGMVAGGPKKIYVIAGYYEFEWTDSRRARHINIVLYTFKCHWSENRIVIDFANTHTAHTSMNYPVIYIRLWILNLCVRPRVCILEKSNNGNSYFYRSHIALCAMCGIDSIAMYARIGFLNGVSRIFLFLFLSIGFPNSIAIQWISKNDVFFFLYH